MGIVIPKPGIADASKRSPQPTDNMHSGLPSKATWWNWAQTSGNAPETEATASIANITNDAPINT